MKKIVLFLFMLPCILFSQVQDPCSNSIIDYLTDHENANKPISYQLSQGWNMVGYYGTAQNNEMSTQINEESLSDASTIEETFQVIKNVSGQFWSPQFSQLNTLTPGEGYMMYVITDSPPAISFNAQFQMPQISGCTNCSAENFRPIATVDDGSCLILGCTSDWADNYNLEATVDDGSCYKYGCTGIGADNYDALATTNDGSCLFPIGCTEQWADNYNSYAVTDDGSCYRVGCDDQTADNYDEIATVINNNNCVYSISVDDFDFVPTVTDNNMSAVFSAGTFNDFVGGSLMAFKADGTPVSASYEILEVGSGGIAPQGTDAMCGCDLADPGDTIDFAILMNGETIVMIDVDPPVTYAASTFEMISDNFLSFSIDGAPVVFGCTDSESTNYNELATLDNGSCDFSLSIAVGDLAEGGIVFYVDETGQHGLVAATEDLGTYQWGCYETSISGADGESIGTGYQNTLDIVSGCSETPIAASEALAYESEGYSDWYLPSKDELVEMYNTIGKGSPEGNIGGFSNDYYWPSSEFNLNYAWYVSFTDGYTYFNYKGAANRVRVIRAF